MKNNFIRSKNLSRFLAISILLMAFTTSCKKDDSSPKSNNSDLLTEIQTVQGLLNGAQEGNAVGDYILGSVTTLQDALSAAQTVSGDATSTQDALDQAFANLQDAQYSFQANQIEDASLKFSANGSDSTLAVEQSDNSAEIFNLSVFTFEAWVYYTDKPGFFGQIASTEFYEGGLRGWNLRIGDGDALDFAIADSAESRLQPDVTEHPEAIVPRNEWVHVACTFDGTNMKSYINGILIGTLDASVLTNIAQTATLDGAQPLVLGNSAGFKQPERRLVGKLFDIRFYNVARTATEIASDKDYILTGDESGLVAYWPIAKATSNTLITDAAKNVQGENNLQLEDGAIVSTRN